MIPPVWMPPLGGEKGKMKAKPERSLSSGNLSSLRGWGEALTLNTLRGVVKKATSLKKLKLWSSLLSHSPVPPILPLSEGQSSDLESDDPCVWYLPRWKPFQFFPLCQQSLPFVYHTYPFTCFKIAFLQCKLYPSKSSNMPDPGFAPRLPPSPSNRSDLSSVLFPLPVLSCNRLSTLVDFNFATGDKEWRNNDAKARDNRTVPVWECLKWRRTEPGIVCEVNYSKPTGD